MGDVRSTPCPYKVAQACLCSNPSLATAKISSKQQLDQPDLHMLRGLMARPVDWQLADPRDFLMKGLAQLVTEMLVLNHSFAAAAAAATAAAAAGSRHRPVRAFCSKFFLRLCPPCIR